MSATETKVEPHDVKVEGTFNNLFNHRTDFTFSIPVWSRAQEQADARAKEQSAIANRLQALKAQSKTPAGKVAPAPPPSTSTPSLVPEPAPAPAGATSFLPGANPDGPIEQAARIVAGFTQAGQQLEREGAALVTRLQSNSSPTADERASFLTREESWRLSVRYMINWFTERSRTEAVQALQRLLGDSAMSGPKLDHIRTLLGG